MDVTTTRFGTLSVSSSDILLFEDGMIGMHQCRRWILLADAENPALGWLQCVELPELALGVVSPRRFVADYQVRISRQEIAALQLTDARDAHVVVTVARHADGLSLNLRAPLVINVRARRGRQVVAKDPLPVQFALWTSERVRRSA